MIDQFATPFGKWILIPVLLTRYLLYIFFRMGIYLSCFFTCFLFAVTPSGIANLVFALRAQSFFGIGAFPYINFSSMLLFFLLIFGNIYKRTYRSLDKWKIYYDGNCFFCQRSLQLIKTILLVNKIPSYPAQSIITVKTDMDQENSGDD